MDLEIRHLKLVDAIARDGGMTKAAGRLHLTQSALSHQLREIEDRLGTPIFLRLSKRMLLTGAGEKLLATARMVLDEMASAEGNIRRMAAGQEGTLRISTQCNTGYHWLPSMLKSFQKSFPGVEVQIVVEATQNPARFLLDGKLDIAILFKPAPTKGLRFFPLFRDEMLVLMHPEHRLAARPFVRAQDFLDETLITYSTPKEESQLFQKILTPASVTPRNTVHVMLTEAILEMVKSGMGISVMARWAVEPYLRSGTLKGLRLTRAGFYREWMAAMLTSAPCPAYCKEFIDLLSRQSVPASCAAGKPAAGLKLFANAR